MKHEILSWNAFTFVSKFHCVRFSSIKKIVFTEKRHKDIFVTQKTKIKKNKKDQNVSE